MKTKQTGVPCYEGYLELCSSLNLRIHEKKIKLLLDTYKPEISVRIPFGSCLIDYSGNKYLYASDNCTDIIGHSLMSLPKGPLSQLCGLHPEDMVIFNSMLFPDILKFLQNVPLSDYERYRFSFSYRFYQNNGNMLQLLQHSTYLEPTHDGKPLLNMSIFSDISDFKTDTQMKLTINYLTMDRGYIPIYKKYYSLEKALPFSSRELEILKLSLEGLSAKMIADKLYISIHTVKNHKRNMMDKSSTNNITELINFTLKSGISI